MLPNFDHIWPLFGQETNIALLDSLEFCMHVFKLSKRVKPGPYVPCLHESEKEWLKSQGSRFFVSDLHAPVGTAALPAEGATAAAAAAEPAPTAGFDCPLGPMVLWVRS